ncbi:hypothetical protein VKT23_019305 [Stygiomarasmius scandens]|uniref:Uncharacterized protein n=1 Tax=Marasmiellus scandens TaxID=2682957 RepID=A0ABR1IP43_9AGAR
MGVRWTTDKQLEFLQGKENEFQDAREAGRVEKFYTAVTNEFLAKFPVELTEAERIGKTVEEMDHLLTKKIEATKMRVKKWHQNNGYTEKRKLKRIGTGKTSVITKVAVVSGLAGRSSHQLQETEVYHRLFTEDVNESVERIMAAEEASPTISIASGTESESSESESVAQARAQKRLLVLRQVLHEKVDAATPEQRDQIKSYRESDKEEKKRKVEALNGDNDGPIDIDSRQAILALPGFLADIFAVSRKATDYSFYVFAGGKNPNNPEVTETFSWYVGRELNGLPFSKVYPQAEDGFSLPWGRFIKNAYGQPSPKKASSDEAQETAKASSISTSDSESPEPLFHSSGSSGSAVPPLIPPQPSVLSHTPSQPSVPIMSTPSTSSDASHQLSISVARSTHPTNEIPMSVPLSNDFLVSSSSSQPHLNFPATLANPGSSLSLDLDTPFPTSNASVGHGKLHRTYVRAHLTSFNGGWTNELGGSGLRADSSMFGDSTTNASSWTSGQLAGPNLTLVPTLASTSVPTLAITSRSDFLFPTPNNDSGVFPSTISSLGLGGTQHSVPSNPVAQDETMPGKKKGAGRKKKGKELTDGADHGPDPAMAVLQPTQSSPKRQTLKRKELDGLSPSAMVDGKRAQRSTVPGRLPQNIVPEGKSKPRPTPKPRKKVTKSTEVVLDADIKSVNEGDMAVA